MFPGQIKIIVHAAELWKWKFSAVSFLETGALHEVKLSIPYPVFGIKVQCSLNFLSCLYPVIFFRLTVYHISFVIMNTQPQEVVFQCINLLIA